VKSEPDSYEDVEDVISDHMAKWVKLYSSQKTPDVSLVFGSSLFGEPRLYLCQPPATIIEKNPYVGAGTGARVTDPIANTMIVHYDVPWRTRVWQTAYLAYCAKKNDGFCGGDTHVLFFPKDSNGYWILPASMKQAEALGEHFDTYLRSALWNVISSEGVKRLQELQQTATEYMMLNITVIAKFPFQTVPL